MARKYCNSGIRYNAITEMGDETLLYKEFRERQLRVFPRLYATDGSVKDNRIVLFGYSKIYSLMCDLNRDVKFNEIRNKYYGGYDRVPIAENYYNRILSMHIHSTFKKALLYLVSLFLYQSESKRFRSMGYHRFVGMY